MYIRIYIEVTKIEYDNITLVAVGLDIQAHGCNLSEHKDGHNR
jgi:hypothetical protein